MVAGCQIGDHEFVSGAQIALRGNKPRISIWTNGTGLTDGERAKEVLDRISWDVQQSLGKVLGSRANEKGEYQTRLDFRPYQLSRSSATSGGGHTSQGGRGSAGSGGRGGRGGSNSRDSRPSSYGGGRDREGSSSFGRRSSDRPGW